ncbi:MAG: hypothetical protein DRP20_01715 [Thermotogae bacterium]|nr:MAG: hypothetical protein DRP20_01715 [Thermotogota bacterium]
MMGEKEGPANNACWTMPLLLFFDTDCTDDTDLANKIRDGGFRTAGKYDIPESREKFLEAVRG